MISGISITIDASGLNAMIAAAQVYSKRTPAVAVNTAAYVVAKFAWHKMPVTDIGRIDSELAVDVTPVIGKRGRPLSMKYAKNRLYSANLTPSGAGAFKNVPLSWLLISARALQTSEYNIGTSWHWLIGGGIHPLKGHAVSEFASIMQAIISRMVKARHSSTHFLQSCWIPAIRALEPFADRSAVRGRAASAGPRSNEKFVPDSGSAIPAVEGVLYAVAEIINAAGMKGYGDALDRKHNEALWLYGGPALQEAIDDEARNTMQYVNDHEFDRAFGPLRAKGFLVS